MDGKTVVRGTEPYRGQEGTNGAHEDAHYLALSRFFDEFARDEDDWLEKTGAYHDLVEGIYRAIVPPGRRVLEIGCGRGDLLAALSPVHGVGVDVSEGMMAAARERHPHLEFTHGIGETLQLDERFDYIVLSDLVPYVYDLQSLFSSVAEHCHSRTRVVISTYSNVWRPLLHLLTLARLRPDRPVRNWVAPKDLINLAQLAGLEPVVQRNELLLPTSSPLLSKLANGILARVPGLRSLTLTYWLVARPAPRSREECGVSVIVPCRNEAGSIATIVDRVPEMGRGTELVFVEGGSSDDTRERIEQEIERRDDRDIRLVVQSGKGKWNAVQEGFAAAQQEILMILDGDLTVPPEDLPKFYEALVSGRGELINGTRLVYGMERGAMRFLNLLGNKLFATLMSFVLSQYVKDTLCGTKVLYKKDYEQVASRRLELGAEDPFGDFDLLLGASLAGYKIVDIPVRYRARVYGATNIHRFSSGRDLLRLFAAAFRRIWVKPVVRDRGT